MRRTGLSLFLRDRGGDLSPTLQLEPSVDVLASDNLIFDVLTFEVLEKASGDALERELFPAEEVIKFWLSELYW